MGKIFKFGCLGIIALIVLGAIGAALGGGDDDKKEKASTEPKQETQAPAAKEEPKKEEVKKEEPKKEEPKKEEAPKNKPGISKAEFDQIQNGMSYDEVKAIIGSDGEVLSETGQAGEQFHTIMYKWDGEKGFGANANFMFQEGKLQNKSQFGLK
ncbi:DUF3862 domain-containing protein [Bacillus cereus]|uniref:DUF3862 domain-containing protein n=1 Tax=Bacillus thuringiensis TaxID=1428 RepID=A0A9X5RQI5_BACTU|nr:MULTISPECIES: DUF3862 domain-containing protein [Bacillus cereus group]MBJ8090217.1 DUF3862 domain-containing protein [Bacillus cereus]OFC94591.1 hypothetical protein BTGOE4_09810 [Bacillus thuringiensis]PDY73578.1 DUF3862 domain-containing protein [Bacillus cereus]PEE11791.1 DUF3862 domain-containing protein [Bacillus cereus]PFP85789.1 DUF3862 domain-containing protein [Bacillus cereus]